MDKYRSAASDMKSTLAAIKEIKQMYISTIDSTLKLSVVFAALDGTISYQTAHEIIQKQGLRGV